MSLPKAIIYCRVSSDRQVRDGHGLEGQEARCRQYAQNHGYEVAAVFREEGVSGGIVEREVMQQVLDYLDAHGRGGEHVVLIDDIKRLARNLVGHFTLRKAISSRGARLESPSHRFGEEPEAVFVESIMAATAQLERDQNRKQVRNRMQARLEAGYWPFYPPPGYAFEKVPGHGKMIVPREPEAAVIREALEGYASGRFPTQADVRRFLAVRCFKPQAENASQFREFVRRLLLREVYAGFVTYPPWNVSTRRGHHKPLISPDTFERIQNRLRERQKLPPRKDLNADFPLRGFLLCPECRRPYTAAWSKGRTKASAYYRCNTTGCGFYNKSVRADRVHADLEAVLAKLKPRPALLEGVRTEFLGEWERRMLDVDTVRAERQQKLDAIQAEIEGYLLAVGKCSSPTVIKRIEEQVEALEARRVRLGGPIAGGRAYDFETSLGLVLDFLQDLHAVWRTGDLDQRRLVLRLVFTDPLVYHRESGFETPSFSLPINVSCVLELDELELVDMVRRSWNSLESAIFEWAAAIRGLAEAKNVYLAA